MIFWSFGSGLLFWGHPVSYSVTCINVSKP